MHIKINEDYNVVVSTALLGYVGETNARPVSVEGLTVDGADRYVMTIDYGDGVQYEVDITGGQWTPTADILRSAQTVSCQICAKKLSGQEYILLKKSRIFRLRIGAAIDDNAIPSPSVAADALNRISAIGEQVEADVERAENAASTAMQAAENAKKSATAAEKSADTATQAAERAETAAQTAQSIADSLPDDYVTAVGKIAENTAEIANVKLTDKELQRRVNALYDIGQGITHRFETDTDTAYQKAVPTGAKLMSVKSIGGHSEVIDGEIVSAGVTEVVEQGRNLFDVEKCAALGLYYGFEIDTNKTLQIALKDGKTCPTNVSFGIAYIRGNTMANWLITSQGLVETKTDSSKMTDSTQIMVVCYPGNKETMQSIADAFDIMLVDGIYKPDTMPAYAPFHRNEYPIPEAIRALPGYGWSAGTARNYVDYENKRYVQCVGAVDLGTLTWTYGNLPFGWGDNQWFSAPIQSIKIIPTNTQLANVLCKKYTTRYAYVADGNDFFRVDKSIGQHQGVARVTVLDTAYTDAATFKQAMQGVILYYELANPIVTDISSILPDDFLRNMEVEAKGSITFKNSNDDSYCIPVPSEEEYIVKLSEVGGTT